MRPRVGSLFSGVGGFEMGLEQAGFDVAWQVEIDNDAVSVLERHWPDTPRVRDVRDAGAHNLAPVDDPEAGLRRGLWPALLLEVGVGLLIGVVVALWLLEVGS